MFRSFEEIEEFVLRNRRTRVRIALAAAQDEPALSALVEARRKGVARGVLLGREAEIRALLAQMGEKTEDYRILDCPDEASCAALAAKLFIYKSAQLNGVVRVRNNANSAAFNTLTECDRCLVAFHFQSKSNLLQIRRFKTRLGNNPNFSVGNCILYPNFNKLTSHSGQPQAVALDFFKPFFNCRYNGV